MAKIKRNFRSKFEQDVFNKAKKINKNIKYEDAVLHYTSLPKNHRYTPDIVLWNEDNVKSTYYSLFIEIKGRLTSTDRKKYEAVKRCYPSIDLRFVFQRPKNKIYKGSSTTYANWADDHDFIWAEKEIPKEWIK